MVTDITREQAIEKLVADDERIQYLTPLTDIDLAVAAVEFANGRSYTATRQLIRCMDIGGTLSELSQEADALRARVEAGAFNVERDRLRTGLNLVMSGRVTADVLLPLCFVAREMVLVPRRDVKRGRVVMRYCYVAKDLWTILAHVLLLFLDKRDVFGARLCKCQLASCGKFFMKRQPARGRPVTRYHSPACAAEAVKLKTAVRVTEYRARKKSARKTKGRAR